MKKLVMVVCLVMVTTLAYGGIAKVKGETMISDIIGRIYSQSDNLRNSIAVSYKKSKDYILAHPGQFEGSDKTKLKGLAAKITVVKNAIAALKTYIETNFPGIQE